MAQPGSQCSEGHSRHRQCHWDLLLPAMVHLPGLTVWPKVIFGTLADIAMGVTGLSGTHGLMLTWVQVTHVSTVVTIVTWDQKDRRGSIPTFPWHFLQTCLHPSPSILSSYTSWLWLCSAGGEAQRGDVTSPRSHGRARVNCRRPALANLPHFPGSLAYLDRSCRNSCPSRHCNSCWQDMGSSHRGLAGYSLAPH